MGGRDIVSRSNSLADRGNCDRFRKESTSNPLLSIVALG